MLELFRKYARHPIIKVILFAVIITFIGFYGWGSVSEKKALYVAEVEGNLISGKEFDQSFREQIAYYEREYDMKLTPEMIKGLNLKQNVLDKLIQQRLILAEADKLGLKISKKEIQRSIAKNAVFQKDGQFDEQRYFEILRQNNLTPTKFEEIIHTELLLKKIMNFMKPHKSCVWDLISLLMHLNSFLCFNNLLFGSI